MKSIQHEDTKRVADLIGEYSDKLRRDLELRRKRNLVRNIIAPAVSSVSFGILGFITVSPSISSDGLSQELNNPVSLFVISALLILGIGSLVGMVFYSSREVEHDIIVSSSKLSKVVRYASQTLEHDELSTAEQLEMELRLSDAEATLDRAERDMDNLQIDRKR